MFNISDYLQKFRNLTSHEGQVKDAVRSVLYEELGVEVERDTVSYKGKQVFIHVHPLIKNEVTLNKRTLLRKIRARVSCVVEDIK